MDCDLQNPTKKKNSGRFLSGAEMLPLEISPLQTRESMGRREND